MNTMLMYLCLLGAGFLAGEMVLLSIGRITVLP